jgi:4-amino-4-deoxy-L-arabinose transferase-like glycosyltransferase
LGIFMLALALRLLHLLQIRHAPFHDLLLGDSLRYHHWAGQLAAGDWLGSEVFYQAPLYPYFLGSIYAVVGADLAVVRVIQAVVGSFSCVLLAEAGRALLGRRVGVIAGLMLAIYPPAIFFGSRIDKSVLGLFFVCLILWLLSRQLDGPSGWRWLASGVVLGMLILTRENALVFAFALLVWLAATRRRWGARLLPFAALFALGVTGVLLPVAARNHAVGGGFHLTTSNFGPNFFIGNNPDANGTYAPLLYGRGSWQYEQPDATALAEEAVGRKLTGAEVSAFWTGRALAYIRSEPLDWLILKGRTLTLLGNAVEIVDAEDQYSHSDWSLALRAIQPVLHFGTLLPLACLGIWVTWDRRDRLLFLYLMLIAYAASVLLFFVFARFRLPLVPFLVLLAAAGLTDVWPWLRSASRSRVAGALATTALVAAFCNWPVLTRDFNRAITHMNTGSRLLQRGDRAGAILELERAVALEPGSPLAHFNLGNALKEAARHDDAIASYREAGRLRPEYYEVYNNWGVVLLDQGRIDEAIERFHRVLSIEPESALAHANLGAAYRTRGDLDRAGAHYREALRIDPGYRRARAALSEMRRGDIPDRDLK